MTSVRRALAGRTVFLLAAAGAVLLAPYAHAAGAPSQLRNCGGACARLGPELVALTPVTDRSTSLPSAG
jgi:hypothetical protein